MTFDLYRYIFQALTKEISLSMNYLVEFVAEDVIGLSAISTNNNFQSNHSLSESNCSSPDQHRIDDLSEYESLQHDLDESDADQRFIVQLDRLRVDTISNSFRISNTNTDPEYYFQSLVSSIRQDNTGHGENNQYEQTVKYAVKARLGTSVHYVYLNAGDGMCLHVCTCMSLVRLGHPCRHFFACMIEHTSIPFHISMIKLRYTCSIIMIYAH